MSILTRPIEELLSYLLTRLHGGILLQQLDHRNFSASVSEGVYTLKDLQLNPQAINQHLSESVVHMFSSKISVITISVPSLFKFLEDPINFTVKNIVVDLCSASESGCSVIKEQKAKEVEKEEDIPGITILTKSIGNFLSKIIFQASSIKIRIRHRPEDRVFVQVLIQKVSFYDAGKQENESCCKILKIEGLRVSVMKDDLEIYDPNDYSNILVMEKEVLFEINISKDLLFVECLIEKLVALISFEQVSILIKIFSSLKKSVKYDDLRVSILMETFQAIGEDLSSYSESARSISIRQKSIKFNLNSFTICTALEEIGPFKKTWNYHEEIHPVVYPGVPTSHIISIVHGLSLEHSSFTSLRIVKLVANHFNYLPNPALESSALYASAKQSFFPDFFRNKPDSAGLWEADINKSHFCHGNILSFKKNHLDFSFHPPILFRKKKNDLKIKIIDQKIIAKIAAIDIHINSALISALNKLIVPSESAPSKINENIEINIPYVRLQYQENFDKCFCVGKEWMLMCEIFLVKLTNAKDLELSASKVEVCIVNEELCSSVLLACNLKVIKEIKESVNNILLEELKEEPIIEYYEPKQGMIYLRPGKHTEEFGANKNNPIKNQGLSAIEEEMGLARASCLTKVNIYSLNLRLEASTLEKFLFLLPENSEGKKTEIHPAANIVEIGNVAIELLNREINQAKPAQPSLFSYYSLDASINKTVNAANDSCVGLITMNFNDIHINNLNNCVKSKGKYTRVKIAAIEMFAKQQEMAYGLGTNVLEILIEKTEIDEVSVNFSNFLICSDVFLKYLTFLSGFSLDLPKSPIKLNKNNIKIQGIFIDYLKNDQRILLGLESGIIEVINNNDVSTGIVVSIDSARAFLNFSVSQAHPIFSSPFHNKTYENELISNGYLVILTLDTLGLSATIVNSKYENMPLPTENYVPKFLKCMLGSKSCKPLSGPICISEELRSSILIDKLLDVHINLGSFILHVNSKIIVLLHDFIEIPNNNEEPDEIIRNDSDLSSDDPDTFSAQLAGLTINPNEPDKIININLQEHLGSGKKSVKKEEKVEKNNSIYISKRKTIHCHSEIPKHLAGKLVDSNLHMLNSHHGCPNLRFSAVIFLIIVNIYNDASPKHFCKPHSSRIMLKSENISMTFSKFPKKLHFSWRFCLTIENLKINDYIINSAVNTILVYDSNFQRKPNSNILHIEVCAVWPRPAFSNETELIISFNMLPLKLNIDQFFIEFCLELADWKPEEQVLMRQTGNPPAQHKNSSEDKHSRPKFFYLQRLSIDTICLNIDYIPHKLEGRYPGSQILNMFQIQDFKLLLPPIDVKGAKNLIMGVTQAWNRWLEHIKDREIYKLISGIGPISAIKNMSEALYDIISLPYSTNPANDTTKKAIVGLVKSLSVESLTIVESMVTGIYTVLMGCGNAVGINLPSRQALVRPLHDVQCMVDRKRLEKQHEKFKD